MSLHSIAVTGAFSYSGSYIAEAFLEAGWQVRTLTRRPERQHRLQGKVEALPLDFEDQPSLVAGLQGIEVLVNTYWVRFDYQGSSFAQAIRNSGRLFLAAREAGVKRIVHLSVSNPDTNSELPYYAGKAKVEHLLRESGVPHSILRPTLIFGEEELLVNNIAWLIRKAPLFVVPGDGQYCVQPIYVRDLAALALREAQESENHEVNAAAGEVLTYGDMIHFLKDLIGSETWLLYVPPAIAIGMARLLSIMLRDVLLTHDELDGLMQERLYVGDACIEGLAFSDWARENAQLLGAYYTNEIQRHHQRNQ